MKKLLVMLLALVVVISAFAACNPADEPGESSPDASSSSSASGDASQSDGSSSESESDSPTETEGPGLPELNYNDAEVNIACWSSYCPPEFDVAPEDRDGDPVADAVYKRNLYTEQLLGIKLVFQEYYTDGGTTGIQAYGDALVNATSDPSTVVDIIASYSRSTAQCFVKGLVQPMDIYEALDLSREWWPKNIQEEFNINGKIYFTSGDIAPSLLNYMYGVFYNKDLCDQYGYTDLYKMIDENTWTLDSLIEMTAGVYEDRDDTAGKSAGDFFGLTLRYYNMDATIQGSGFKLVSKSDEEGEVFRLSDDFTSEKFANFISDMIEWTKTDDVYNERPFGGSWDGSAADAFLDGRSLFEINQMQHGFALQDSDIDYRIMPMPKFDADQTDYSTCVDNPYSLYAICRDTADGDRAAATIQAMGFYGMKYTTPAVYDVTFKGKFSKDDEGMAVLDLILQGVGFDFGRLFTIHLGWIADIPTDRAIAQGTQWSTVMGTLQQKALDRYVKNFNSTLIEIVEKDN